MLCLNSMLKIFSLYFIFISSPRNLILSYNGGKDCTVLLDLVAKIWRRFPELSEKKLKAVYVSEKEPFPELEDFVYKSIKK